MQTVPIPPVGRIYGVRTMTTKNAVSPELRAKVHEIATELLDMGFALTGKPIPVLATRARVLRIAFDLLDKRLDRAAAQGWSHPGTSLLDQGPAASDLLAHVLKSGGELGVELAHVEDRVSVGRLREALVAVEAQLKADGLIP